MCSISMHPTPVFVRALTEHKTQYGEMAVATAGSACSLDMSDESSSITVGASTPGADDEDIDNSHNDM